MAQPSGVADCYHDQPDSRRHTWTAGSESADSEMTLWAMCTKCRLGAPLRMWRRSRQRVAECWCGLAPSHDVHCLVGVSVSIEMGDGRAEIDYHPFMQAQLVFPLAWT